MPFHIVGGGHRGRRLVKPPIGVNPILPVALVVFSQDPVAITSGQTATGTATPTNANGVAVLGKTVTAVPSDTSKCTVSLAGYNFTVTAAVGLAVGSYTSTIIFSCDGVSNVLDVNITIASSPSGGTNPDIADKEPAGALVMAETSYATLTPFTDGTTWSTQGMITGECTRRGANYVSITDPSPLHSPGAGTAVKYNSGMQDGSSGFAEMNYWSAGRGANDYGFDEKSELYYAFDLQLLGNSTDPANPGSDYQNQGVGTKLYYIAYGNKSRQNHSFFLLYGTQISPRSGAPNGSLQTSMNLKWYITQMNADGTDPGHSNPESGNVNDPATGAPKRIVVGTKYTIKAYMKKNTGNNADGIAKAWINDVLTFDRSDIRWTSLTNNHGFYNLRLDPVWGGDYGSGQYDPTTNPNGGQYKNRDDYNLLGHLYLSGK
jgi:hypothetical protein